MQPIDISDWMLKHNTSNWWIFLLHITFTGNSIDTLNCKFPIKNFVVPFPIDVLNLKLNSTVDTLLIPTLFKHQTKTFFPDKPFECKLKSEMPSIYHKYLTFAVLTCAHVHPYVWISSLIMVSISWIFSVQLFDAKIYEAKNWWYLSFQLVYEGLSKYKVWFIIWQFSDFFRVSTLSRVLRKMITFGLKNYVYWNTNA